MTDVTDVNDHALPVNLRDRLKLANESVVSGKAAGIKTGWEGGRRFGEWHWFVWVM